MQYAYHAIWALRCCRSLRESGLSNTGPIGAKNISVFVLLLVSAWEETPPKYVWNLFRPLSSKTTKIAMLILSYYKSNQVARIRLPNRAFPALRAPKMGRNLPRSPEFSSFGKQRFRNSHEAGGFSDCYFWYSSLRIYFFRTGFAPSYLSRAKF